MKLQENSVFANRYELQKLLGRGGFSEVWLAKDQWTHLNVAIKVYAPGQGMEEDGMNEFCGELAQVYDINHSNLLQPKHVDNWENMPYLIMAYCPNGSCAKLVGKATEEQMWKIIHDVASGLAYLHENDVVHQDIKPANILIGENGHYLITDFGVSSRARSTLRKSVVFSTGGGTTAYMGPERFSKQPAPTKASDIWSFGAMCFELVECDVPFGDNGGLSQRLSAEIPTINANVSEALKFTINKMLQKETWDRPTAATLMEWAAAPQSIKIENTPPMDRPTERRNSAPVAEPEVRETARQNALVSNKEKDNPANKNKKVIWVLVGVVAILIGVVCLLVFGNMWKEDDGGEMPVRDTVAMGPYEVFTTDHISFLTDKGECVYTVNNKKQSVFLGKEICIDSVRIKPDTYTRESSTEFVFPEGTFVVTVGTDSTLYEMTFVVKMVTLEELKNNASVDSGSQGGGVNARIQSGGVTGVKPGKGAKSATTSKILLKLEVVPAGAGKVEGAGEYENGEKVTIKAVPAEGFAFTKWSDGNTEAERKYLVKPQGKQKVITLKANFVKNDGGSQPEPEHSPSQPKPSHPVR